MSHIRITPAELASMIQRLRGWSSSMDHMRSAMQSSSSAMQSAWSDPQYALYITQIQNMAEQMKQSSDELVATAKALDILKRNLERTQAEFRSHMHRG